MNMYVRMHTDGKERIVAACDEDILGMTFREGNMKITVHEGLYKGEVLEEEAFIQRLGIATIINLVGNGVVDLAIREGFVSPDSVLVIDGVKHAQAVQL